MPDRRPRVHPDLLRAEAALAAVGGAAPAASVPAAGDDPDDPERSGVRGSGETLPRRVLRVATALFAERGYQGTSLREVAAAAGCTKPALYYHFGNKESLFLAALRTEAEALTDLLDASLAQAGSVRDRLVDAIRAFVAHCRLHPSGLALLEHAEALPDEGQPSFDFASIRTVHLGLARRLLEDGVAAGELRGDLPVDEAVLALAGLVHQRTERFLRDGQPIPHDFPERAIDLLLRGMAREDADR